MNEDVLTGQTEKFEKVGWGIIRWAIYITIPLLMLGGAFWFFFYSDYLANNYAVIPARTWYQDSYQKIKNLSVADPKDSQTFTPIYTIQAHPPLESGLNTFTFVGKLAKIDVDHKLIYLLSSEGKIYIFRIENAIRRDSDFWLTIAQVTDVSSLAKGISTTSTSTPPESGLILSRYRNILIKDGVLTAPVGTLGIRWNDARTLSQIEQDYLNDENIPLNESLPDSSVLAEFKLKIEPAPTDLVP